MHLNTTYLTHAHLQNLLKEKMVLIVGTDLDIATVVAVAKFGCRPFIDKTRDLMRVVEESQAVLQDHLVRGSQIYGISVAIASLGYMLTWEFGGVNTGFGGNADIRTDDVLGLQQALIQHQNSAILTTRDLEAAPDGHGEMHPHSMPTSWVKGAMLVRCNTNVRGHSAISWRVVNRLTEFLQRDLTPIVPLRGSISASGDLMPLSYIAGMLQGNPDIHVRMGRGSEVRVINSEQALKELRNIQVRAGQSVDMDGEADFSPIVLGPKEGLALVNGTAPSATVAALALWEANQLAVLSQLITCLTSEVLGANAEWTHPFIAAIRPHPGQIEVAQNLRTFFHGSKLVTGLEEGPTERTRTGMVQDRYSVRSSPQWIGPAIEDLLAATKQLTTELNSTTDNPVVNVQNHQVLCGANFQATSVTMVAEKTRLCLQLIGKMLFSQTSEMINPTLNNGLPPNLAPDDPSRSYCLKGVDINMAAYQSELAFLANPISSHVQSAEMHNQAINSLALVSARYAMQSVEIVSMMTASAIYVGLQGVDLRVMHRSFLGDVKPTVESLLRQLFPSKTPDHTLVDLNARVWEQVCSAWYANASNDAGVRCENVAKATVDTFVQGLSRCYGPHGEVDYALLITAWKQTLESNMLDAFRLSRNTFCEHPTTASYLGRTTKTLYNFVRGELGVPFYRGRADDPGNHDAVGLRQKRTIGSWISIIYEALRSGKLGDEILDSVRAFTDPSTV
ncbi:phenylalanine ammonia-lyase [Rhinocladiella mackenziei CBS 650.93]|uniref:Phenylalanine ammonia-lyase n=1 Tax=Rhinocladiella mackenziei CBS 650.93 TaxID=1442369 RepID=A0A0D2H3R7_9EURO|nr:phenylalanine ammonia-lyase [Rhinocladiella mackenziei CBS 650.93]KIX05028.1 phenylalanine ammonia-lyase [Rhinocladiella mackenziei CBS 650.93]